MSKQHIPEAIDELNAMFEELKALLAWHRFKQWENRQCGPVNFQCDDTLLQDLNNRYLAFLSQAMRIRAALDDPKLTEHKRKTFQQQIAQLELQAGYLGSPVNIY